MDDRRRQLVEEVFLEAVALRDSGGTETRVVALIEGRCGADGLLRAEIESLLGAHRAEDGVLDRAEVVLAGTLGMSAGGSRLSGRLPWQEPTLPPGAIVGGYTVQRVLGAGGMGVVYVAQQERPRRTVALKVIRPALTSPGMLRRFEAEAEILGRLHHAGIAQIYEAGVADGQPFLAMELVEGPSLIDYAEQRGLGTRERLELVARVCDGVQHAHQKGVIHRDLKPSNILVESGAIGAETGQAGLGQPKILDFGVARATDSDLHVSTLRTSVGQLIGTLPYMSPEQVAGDQDEVDTRSDVYALGVVLYQLLAGRLPHDVASRSIPEAARVIRDEHPSRLSAVSRVFRGDIETIVAKAMEKDRERRYQSASALGDDIRRYLAGEPIAAKRDSAMYLLRTQLRRYRGTVAAAGAFVAVLIAFGAYASVLAATNARLARSLTAELSTSNIERGRALALAGSAIVGESALWRELLIHPDSRQAHWALWEHYSRRPILRAVRAGEFHAGTAALAPDGSIAVVRGPAPMVQVWNGDFTRVIRTHTLEEGATQVVAVAPDGSMFVTGDQHGHVHAWEPRTGRKVREFAGAPGTPGVAAFSPDGSRLVCGCLGGGIAIWDTSTGRRLWTTTAHRGTVWAVAFSGDGRLFATSGREETIRVWNTGTFTLEGTVPGRADEVRALRFAGGSQVLIASGTDGVIRLLTWPVGELLGTLRGGGGVVHSLALSQDESTLVCGGSGVELWDLHTQRLRAALTRGDGAEYHVHIRPGDGAIVTTGSTGRILLWEPEPLLARRTVCDDHGAWVLGLAVSPDGSRLVSCDLAQNVRVWDTASGTVVADYNEGQSTSARSPRFSPDGRTLATGLGDGVVTLRDTSTWEVTGELRGPNAVQISAVEWSPDGTRIVTGGTDGDAAVWDVASGRRLATLALPAPTGAAGLAASGATPIAGRVLWASWSPDGRQIAICATNPTVSVWDARTFRPVFTLPGKYPTWSAAFSPDGSTLACAAPSREIVLYDTRTWRARVTLEGHSKPVLTVAFSPDGALLASCGADGTIRLWDPTIRPGETAVRMSPGGRFLATLEQLDTEVSRVVFGADGRTLYAGGADKTVQAWDLHYYDRHIAGNLTVHTDRLLPKMTPRPDTAALERWAAGVLAEGRASRPPGGGG